MLDAAIMHQAQGEENNRSPSLDHTQALKGIVTP
jgi:hypothetical protein